MGVAERKAREFRRREEDILAVALNLAGGEDWPSVTVDVIAERAEIGKGTFYMHFKSKDEVCARLVMDHGRSLLERLREIDPAMEYIPRLKQTLRLVWQDFMENREILAMQLYCEVSPASLNLSEGFAAEFFQAKSEMVEFFQSLIKEGIARGIIASQPLSYLMSAGWATLMGAIRLNDANFPELSGDENYLEYLIDYILKGLMNAQGGSATSA